MCGEELESEQFLPHYCSLVLGHESVEHTAYWDNQESDDPEDFIITWNGETGEVLSVGDATPDFSETYGL